MRCLDKTKISSRFIKKAFKGSEKLFKVLLLQFRKLKKSKYIALAKGQYDEAQHCFVQTSFSCFVLRIQTDIKGERLKGLSVVFLLLYFFET